jgi:hypothetical protein
MSDNPNETDDDAVLTKPKKVRSEAQKAAFEKMKNGLAAKQIASGKLTPDEKKIRLIAIREQLNGPPKKNMEKVPEISETDSESEDLPPQKKETKIVNKAPVVKAPEVQTKSIKKKEPKVIYESASESEEEVIIVKKKRKKPKKTIIYESESESEEEPVKKTRDTKTQQNSTSKFKVTLPDYNEVKKPKGPIYYFA